MTYTKHPTAIVDDGAQIGNGTRIWHWVHISGQNVQIGENCSFGQNVYIGNNVTIGRNVKVQNNVSVYDQVTIEDDVFCGPSMVFTNVINPRSHIPRKDEYKKTVVRRGTSIGANATIVCGIELGEYSFVAAGAVVTRSVPAFGLMMGVPARQMAWVCQCGERLAGLGTRGQCTCEHCKAQYDIHDRNCRRLK